MNRYPQLFEIAAKELQGISNPKILSFGCSTGDEVFSIKKYIPNATIVGVDINHRSLDVARKKDNSKEHTFYHYHDSAWQKENHYDCILALAIFQRTEHREADRNESLSTFQFQQFSDSISHLDLLLKHNGILVLDNTDYSFKDLEINKKYTPSKFDSLTQKPRPLYSDESIKKSSISQINRIFKKGGT